MLLFFFFLTSLEWLFIRLSIFICVFVFALQKIYAASRPLHSKSFLFFLLRLFEPICLFCHCFDDGHFRVYVFCRKSSRIQNLFHHCLPRSQPAAGVPVFLPETRVTQPQNESSQLCYLNVCLPWDLSDLGTLSLHTGNILPTKTCHSFMFNVFFHCDSVIPTCWHLRKDSVPTSSVIILV